MWKISITHVETNLANTFTTNDSGQYVAVDLPVGHYNLKAEARDSRLPSKKIWSFKLATAPAWISKLVLGAATETVTLRPCCPDTSG